MTTRGAELADTRFLGLWPTTVLYSKVFFRNILYSISGYTLNYMGTGCVAKRDSCRNSVFIAFLLILSVLYSLGFTFTTDIIKKCGTVINMFRTQKNRGERVAINENVQVKKNAQMMKFPLSAYFSLVLFFYQVMLLICKCKIY